MSDNKNVEYNPIEIEKKWQKIWAEKKVFEVSENSEKPKFYSLQEFPFPSGSGLHVGHARPYTAMDVVARKKRQSGFNVLCPIGYDAFGAQAEQYAIKTGAHPKETTEKNCANFRRQLEILGLSYDWSREINTSHEDYYKWTQWMFLQFFKNGLAYKSEDTINWCPACKMALTNEELEKGCCERCDGEVIQKVKSQWTLKMQSYSEKLLDGLNKVDYSENIKAQQRNWIGKSVGAEIDFIVKVKNLNDEKLTVFTTRADTLFGVTYMVVAPEHCLADKAENKKDVEEYRVKASKKTEFERVELAKDKTGVKLEGVVAINPVNNKEIPVFISDYVMMGYGTGAIMAVPAHDQRDYDFAKKFDCEIIQVLKGGDISVEAFTEDGELINSDFLNGLNKKEAIEKMISWLGEKKLGNSKTTFKMKDWLFSRQRYWGEPVPVVYCEDCKKWVAIPENELPLKLPHVDDYLPTDDGESPLAKATDWVNTVCPDCGGKAKRETDTMPNWAGSSWYYLRYMDPHNDKEFASKTTMKYWGQVDLYEGGQEHTTRHLLYARFWHKALFDMGFVPFDEPFKTRFSHGLILAEDGSKMSKSKGNVVSPDDVVEKYGADSLRTYEMFIAPFTEHVAWNTNAMVGVYRFLSKVYRLLDKVESREMTKVEAVAINKSIKEVGDRIDNVKFNTAVSSLMECLNSVNNQNTVAKEFLEKFVQILNPFAPHISEEIWQGLGHDDLLVFELWPKYDEKFLQNDTVSVAVSVNGKKRDVIEHSVNASVDEIEKIAMGSDKIISALEGKVIKKKIIVPKRIVNFVV